MSLAKHWFSGFNKKKHCFSEFSQNNIPNNKRVRPVDPLA